MDTASSVKRAANWLHREHNKAQETKGLVIDMDQVDAPVIEDPVEDKAADA